MNKLNIAVIGAGWFGRKHCSVWQGIPGARLLAVCDPLVNEIFYKEDAAQASFHVNDKDNFDPSLVKKYTDIKELLRNEEIDVVDICVPEEAHAEVALYALEQEKHIIVEKPFTTSYETAKKIVAMAQTKNRHVYVGNILRFDRRNRMIREKVTGKAAGELCFMSFKRNFQKQAHKIYGRTHPFFSALVHDIDLALWFSGKKVQQVKSFTQHRLKQKHPDVLLGTLEFDDGLLCSLENIWHVNASCPYGFENEMALYADHATIIQRNVPVIEFWNDEKAECPDMFFWPSVDGRTEGALRDMLEHYLFCASQNIESDILPMADAVEGIRVAQMLVEDERK